MSKAALNEILRPLPWALREHVDEYIRAVVELAPGLFEEAEVPMTSRAYDHFIFLAGIRKLWHLVDAQYVLLDGALSLVQGHGVERLTMGRTPYSRESESYLVLRRLRNEMYRELVRLQIYPLVNAESLAELAHHVSDPGRTW